MTDDKLTAGARGGRSDVAAVDAPARLTRRNTTSRQGAIARHLMTYAKYKTWVEKVRNTWDDDAPEDAPEPAPRSARR